MARGGTGHTKFLPTSAVDVIIEQGQQSAISTRIQCILHGGEREQEPSGAQVRGLQGHETTIFTGVKQWG